MKYKMGGTPLQQTSLRNYLILYGMSTRQNLARQLCYLAVICITHRVPTDKLKSTILQMRKKDAYKKLESIFDEIHVNYDNYSLAHRDMLFQWQNPPKPTKPPIPGPIQKTNPIPAAQVNDENKTPERQHVNISFVVNDWQEEIAAPNSKTHAIDMLRAYKTELDKRLENSDRSAAPEPTETCCTIC